MGTGSGPTRRASCGRAFRARRLERVARGGELPLSFAQQRLWFMEQVAPLNAAYYIPCALRLSGPLDVRALEQALTEIVSRHEILRTTFDTLDGDPVQVISPTVTFSLPVVDLRPLPENEREGEALRLAEAEARLPFNLRTGPLFRAKLLCLADDDYIVLVTMHHIISDGWSIGIFFRELAWLYEAFSLGTPSPLPELPIQYTDFTLWQRDWLQGQVLDTQLSYWKQELSNHASSLNLPTDFPRPAVQTYRGAHEVITIPKELTEALKTLAHQDGATLFMALLAAFKLLLYRYSGNHRTSL